MACKPASACSISTGSWAASIFDAQTNVHDLVDYFVDLALKRDSKSRDNEQGNQDDRKEKYIFLDALWRPRHMIP
jgi:hypothetical protein